MKYLSGFMAQKYDVPYENVLPRVQKRVDEHSKRVLEKSIQGYTSHVVTSHHAQLNQIKHDYVLLPVWFMNYHYNGKDYNFAMNGQTGKLVGDLPVDKGRFWGMFAAIAVPLSVLSSVIVLLMR